MKERGILFSAPMVRAILAGTKTQTRRIVKPQPSDKAIIPKQWSKVMKKLKEPDIYGTDGSSLGNVPMQDGSWGDVRCPYGAPGDRLWVRETWSARDGNAVLYKADNVARVFPRSCYEAAELRSAYNRHMNDVRPSIHMPRWASRITLEITAVRVERLQDISEADAIAEGADAIEVGGEDGVSLSEWSHRCGFMELWERINGSGSWDENPWVWVIEFRRV